MTIYNSKRNNFLIVEKRLVVRIPRSNSYIPSEIYDQIYLFFIVVNLLSLLVKF